ncbi:hypothetical protein [Lacticaseibacillus suibinensis]|uniref:hypothetical protein n=1 Tax=Lacticaseibacillus suibinensis TaxID=2486011 RepID=UPI000F78C2C4|nr:hypothetical protein [Lacticaseibacillus suibinensis]
MAKPISKQQKWNAAHPQATRKASDRSATKRYIQKYATLAELDTIDRLVADQRKVLKQREAEALAPLDAFIHTYRFGTGAVPPKGFDIIVSEEVVTASYDGKFLISTPNRSQLDPVRYSPSGALEEKANLHAWFDWVFKLPAERIELSDFRAFPLALRDEIEAALTKYFGYQPLVKIRYSAAAFTETKDQALYYPLSPDPVITWNGPGHGYRVEDQTQIISGDLSLEENHPWAESHPPLLETAVLRQKYEALSPEDKLVYVPADEAPAPKPRTYQIVKITRRKQKDGTEKLTRAIAGKYHALNQETATAAYKADHPHASLANLEIEEI